MASLPVVGDILWLPFKWRRPWRNDPEDKVRPCYILGIDEVAGKMYALPITHSPPAPERAAFTMRIEKSVAAAAGLDNRPNYLVCDEVNVFRRPTKLQEGVVGQLTGRITDEIRDRYRAAMKLVRR